MKVAKVKGGYLGNGVIGLYLYLFNGPGREDVIGQVGCLRPVVKKNCLW